MPINVKYVLVILSYLVISVLLSAEAVYAGSEIRTLYSDVQGTCPAVDLNTVFSGFVCKYQEIVDGIMTDLYYSFLEFFTPPFIAALTLFVILTGCVFALGILPFTTRDIMLVMTKIALVTGFGLNPDLMIDLMYNGFIGFMRQTTDTVVATLAPEQGSVLGIFRWMDVQLADFLTQQENARGGEGGAKCDSAVLALLFGLAVTAPPLFIIAVYLMFQLAMVLIRTVLGYVLAITGIMFLTTLSPLFFAFALFQFTRSYFEKWVSYQIAFSVQIFIVFSFIAVVINLPFGEKLQSISTIVTPYNKTAYHDGQRMNFDNWCTLCIGQSASFGNLLEATENCTSTGGVGAAPTNMQVGGLEEFISFIGKEVFVLALMAYIVESVLKAAPDVSKYLTGNPHVPAFAGKLPLPERLGGAATSGYNALKGTPGSMINRTGAAMRETFGSLMTGGR
jgi:TrbL/VirB6 plasmid conjugal transfer protein